MNTMVPFLWVAGGVHLAIAVSNLWVPGILHYREDLAKVSPMVRQVFVVHSIYMVVVLLAFSALCLFFAPELTSGAPLCRFLCAFLAVFWLLRFVLQLVYYNPEVRARYRLGDIAYTFAVSCLGVVFAVVAFGVVK
jgi:lysylphosphatidylglycerol synthetase-like protein (DUF2156 family)